MRNLRGTTALLLALTLATPAAASVKDGVDAWTRGDFAGAVREWQGPAANGDADAQFNLAQAYKLGKGVPADLKAAEALYLKAAQQGHLQAADTYGLLLFQSGRRDAAMAWLVPSAERGEPRAQYVLGTAHFNGDLLPSDPVRAYALMTRAAAAGLDQARASLATMDQHLALDERQRGVALAAELEDRAATLRTAQFAAADLAGPPAPKPAKAKAETTPVRALTPEPVTAGADFAGPVVIHALPPVDKKATPRAVAVAAAPARAAPVASDGPWRIQLGAFSVPGNAEALWARLKARGGMAGIERFLVASGRLTRLQAGPFAAKAQADAACASLRGQACIAVRK